MSARLDLRIDATKGWQRFALRCCYRLWQLAMTLCCMALMLAIVILIVTPFLVGYYSNPVELLKTFWGAGARLGLPGLIGMFVLGSLEGTLWPTWWG